jgi:hypothetical protein
MSLIGIGITLTLTGGHGTLGVNILAAVRL